jgi:hypothetical protein
VRFRPEGALGGAQLHSCHTELVAMADWVDQLVATTCWDRQRSQVAEQPRLEALVVDADDGP